MLSIKTRLLVSLAILFVIGIFIVGKILISDANTRIEKVRETDATHQVYTLAEGSLDALISEDYELIERWVRSSIPSEDYAYAAIARPDGQIISHTNGYYIGKYLGEINTYDETHAEVFFENRPVNVVSHPINIGSKYFASAYVAYYTDVNHEILGSTQQRISLVMGIMFIILFAGTFMIANRFTKPIESLTEATNVVSLGKPINLAMSLLNRRDEIGALSASFRRMSERLVQAHTKLLNSLEEKEAIVESSHDGIMVVDTMGNIVSANTACEDIFGYTAMELQGKHINILTPSYHHGAHHQLLIDLSKEDKVPYSRLKRRVSGVKKNGEEIHVEIAIKEISISNEKRYSVTLHDADLQAAYENELLHAREAAERNDRLKSEILRNVSHEFRTPLNGIMGILSLLDADDLTEEQREYLLAGMNSAKQLNEIVDRMVSYTETSDEIKIGSLEVFNPRDVVKEMVSEFQPKCIKAGISLVQKTEDNVPLRVSGNRSTLRLILRELMDNAVKYTAQGSVELDLGVKQAEQGEVFLLFTIKDTGVGFDSNKKEEIFEEFVQLDGSSTRTVGGTGIGLASCKKFAAALHGEIYVDSSERRGSTFTLSIPFHFVS
ncbi:MAG: ATP-binding protein [Gammaproteobacteria bacterium]|nr:ATP-binding protein [Gammaproteobacteria bacterium]